MLTEVLKPPQHWSAIRFGLDGIKSSADDSEWNEINFI